MAARQLAGYESRCGSLEANLFHKTRKKETKEKNILKGQWRLQCADVELRHICHYVQGCVYAAVVAELYTFVWISLCVCVTV